VPQVQHDEDGRGEADGKPRQEPGERIDASRGGPDADEDVVIQVALFELAHFASIVAQQATRLMRAHEASPCPHARYPPGTARQHDRDASAWVFQG
jgi:hypothetical protein